MQGGGFPISAWITLGVVVSWGICPCHPKIWIYGNIVISNIFVVFLVSQVCVHVSSPFLISIVSLSLFSPQVAYQFYKSFQRTSSVLFIFLSSDFSLEWADSSVNYSSFFLLVLDLICFPFSKCLSYKSRKLINWFESCIFSSSLYTPPPSCDFYLFSPLLAPHFCEVWWCAWHLLIAVYPISWKTVLS